MTIRRTAFAIALLSATAIPALAASATQEEADRIAAAIQAYVGPVPGVVTVKPAGEHYDLHLDFAPLLAKAAGTGVSATLSPLDLTLEDQGEGKWLVGQDGPFTFSFKAPGTAEASGQVASIKGSGVFDSALGTFVSSTTDVSGLSFTETVTPPDGSTTLVGYTLASLHYETTATSAGDGGADIAARTTMGELVETVRIAATKDTPAIDLTISLPKGTSDTRVAGLRVRPVLDLLAWFIAHPSEGAIVADQAALKEKLGAALPLFKRIEATGTWENSTVVTQLGQFGMALLSFEIAMNGIVADGFLREKMAVEGLTAPEGLVPPWAAGLAPTSASFDFSVSGFDLATPAAIILKNLDLSQKPPLEPEIEAELQRAIMPGGNLTITLGPSAIASQILSLGAEGKMTAGPTGTPSGSATLWASGFDQAMEALKAAPPELGLQQAVTMMIAAKGLSKPGDNGKLLWTIESTPDGGALINGVDPSKM